MDEVNNDNDGVEFSEDTPVAVAPVPQNGTAHTPGQVLNRQITEKYTVSTPVNPLMGRMNRPTYAPVREKEKDDREFLDSFNLKAEAEDYQLSCTRNQPSVNADGDPVPTGIHSKHLFSVMNYDDLVQQIIEVWGGGVYRVTFVDLSGRRAENIIRSINIGIPITQHPPKREKCEKIELPKTLKNVSVIQDESSEESKRRQREFKEFEEEQRRVARQDELDMAKQSRELKKLKFEKECSEVRKALTSGGSEQKNSEIALLERKLDEEKKAREEALRRQDEERKESQRRYEDDKRETQRRADETQRIMMESILKLGESIKEIANRPLPPPPLPDNTLKELGAMMMPVITALITRPVPQLPDNKDLIVAMNENQSRSMQALTTALSKPDNSGEKMFDAMVKLTTKDNSTRDSMIQGLMTALMSKDKGQVLTPDMIFALQDKMEQRFERVMGMTQGNTQQEGGEGAESYDPALGFLGNAGKALFGSLKALMDSAATNPALLELVAKVVGSRNPTDQQLAAAAYHLEHASGGVPPALGYQQQPQLPGYAPIQQMAPYPPMPQQQQPQPAQQRSMPPPMPQAQPGTVQQSVQNELEVATSGLPSNADPEQTAPLTPEELADENLIDAVTRTVEIMIGEAKGKPAKRVWPEDATDHWNKDFIKEIVNQPSEQMRLQMIGKKCDPQTAQRITQEWVSDPNEQAVFWTEFRRFVDMNKAIVNTPLPQPPLPSAPPPVV